MTLRKDAGQVIRKARKLNKMTIRDLSEKANLNFNHIGNIERGLINIKLDTIEQIAEALGKKATLNLE